MGDRERTRQIMKWIRFGETRLRRKYSILKYQNGIGMSIALGSALGMILMGAAYIVGWVPAWVTIVCSAIFASFLHELEHDLIHNLYFKGNAKIQNFMFWIVWLFRANTVNPWFRREIHLLHHKVSGQPDDIEERFITNGMAPGWRRILAMVDPIMALSFQGPSIKRDALRHFRKIKAPHEIGPFRPIFHLLWYTFLGWGALSLVNLGLGLWNETGWVATAHGYLNTAAVVYLIPCWLRQSAIQIVSSNMHYYGNVHSVFEQTQVLDSWLILPLHLFCFNFGSTHGIHHFVVNQPFYLRQAIAPFAKPAMRRYGIPFNDFRSMLRGNRRGSNLVSQDGLGAAA
ncbi:MAG: fatty acid desaturase [Leptospiraceae bacterium]|nr:fatty acid desaturase [Leptospiraceae bacterium]MCB1305375.1 fatty acid desaturase [Leptospiraceae bacterium]